MAATNVTSFPKRNKGWYREDLTEVNEPIRRLLEGYSRVPSGEVVMHVNQIVSLQPAERESYYGNPIHALLKNVCNAT